ncbi:MAG: terminase small subunit [Rhodanobacteraceae bacterium]|nr:terminase small subunit [Rhodanobacteraceae bacterium]
MEIQTPAMGANGATPERCSRADFARLLRVDPANVSRWAHANRIKFDEAGRVLVRESLEQLLMTLDPTRGGSGATRGVGSGGTLDLVRQMLERLGNPPVVVDPAAAIDPACLVDVREIASDRARLMRAQADRVEMQNAITRRELAPVSLMGNVLARAGTRAGRMLDTIPGEIRRRQPEINADALAAVAGIIAKVRNAVANLTLADLLSDSPEDEGSARAAPDWESR